jgi:hypothetical protein
MKFDGFGHADAGAALKGAAPFFWACCEQHVGGLLAAAIMTAKRVHAE